MNIDITSFTSKSNIKPEIAMVLVKNIDNAIRFTATDSFKLIEIIEKNPEFEIADGLYSKEVFKTMLKTKQGLPPTILKDFHYPEYDQIIPKEYKETSILFNRINFNHLADTYKVYKKIFKGDIEVKMLNKFKEGANNQNMQVLKDTKDNLEITILLMPFSN